MFVLGQWRIKQATRIPKALVNHGTHDQPIVVEDYSRQAGMDSSEEEDEDDDYYDDDEEDEEDDGEIQFTNNQQLFLSFVILVSLQDY